MVKHPNHKHVIHTNRNPPKAVSQRGQNCSTNMMEVPNTECSSINQDCPGPTTMRRGDHYDQVITGAPTCVNQDCPGPTTMRRGDHYDQVITGAPTCVNQDCPGPTTMRRGDHYDQVITGAPTCVNQDCPGPTTMRRGDHYDQVITGAPTCRPYWHKVAQEPFLLTMVVQ